MSVQRRSITTVRPSEVEDEWDEDRLRLGPYDPSYICDFCGHVSCDGDCLGFDTPWEEGLFRHE